MSKPPPPKLTSVNLWKRDAAYLRLLMKKLGMKMGETIRYAIRYTYTSLTERKKLKQEYHADIKVEYLPPGER